MVPPRSLARSTRRARPVSAAAFAVVAALLPLALPRGVPAATSAPPAITFVRMATPAEGWARTDDRLLRTDDGGRRWSEATPPGIGSAARAATAFLSGSTAWLAVGQDGGTAAAVFRTTDGGRTWARAATTARNVGQIAFADARHGWMTVDLDSAMSSEAFRLLRTADGGVTWIEVARTDLPGDPVRSGLPISGDKSGVAFLDARAGWIAGYVPRDNYTYLYATQNGGRTWRFQALPLPPGMGTVEVELAAPMVFPPHDAVMTAHVSGAAGSRTMMYVTHDGGAHWVSTAPIPAHAQAVSFVSARVGWAADGATLYATRDAGHHWTVEPPSGLFRDVAELDFVSDAVGWAVVRGTPFLLKTQDGGHTWTAAR